MTYPLMLGTVKGSADAKSKTKDQDNQDCLNLATEQFFADYPQEDEIYNQI